MDEARLEELAQSIRSHGVIQPILVRRVGDRTEIVAGERRWRAAQRAGLLKVPVIYRDVPDERLLEVALIENIQREDLNPIEEAQAYRRLDRRTASVAGSDRDRRRQGSRDDRELHAVAAVAGGSPQRSVLRRADHGPRARARRRCPTKPRSAASRGRWCRAACRSAKPRRWCAASPARRARRRRTLDPNTRAAEENAEGRARHARPDRAQGRRAAASKSTSRTRTNSSGSTRR